MDFVIFLKIKSDLTDFLFHCAWCCKKPSFLPAGFKTLPIFVFFSLPSPGFHWTRGDKSRACYKWNAQHKEENNKYSFKGLKRGVSSFAMAIQQERPAIIYRKWSLWSQLQGMLKQSYGFPEYLADFGGGSYKIYFWQVVSPIYVQSNIYFRHLFAWCDYI